MQKAETHVLDEAHRVEPLRNGNSAPLREAEGPDTGLQCLALLLRLNDKAQTLGQIEHNLALAGQSISSDQILRYLIRQGLKAKRVTVGPDQLPAMPLPAIAPLKDGTYAFLVQLSHQGAVYYDLRERRNTLMEAAEFLECWSGDLILATRRARFAAGDMGRFDVSWFIPAVLKFKAAFSEVFVASIFLQVLGLITPLFFQIVVDKVLAHRSYTTLDVLIVALGAMSLFEVVLGGLRQYLFAHSTNRIDVMLGAKLFHHMQSLPLSFFHARRVGETVARMRELETIRSFLTDSALSSVIDTIFGLLFLIVMFTYSPYLSLIVVASFPFFVGLSLTVTPVLQARIKDKFQRAAENQSFLVETVTAIETVKAMAVEPQFQRRWEDQLASYVASSFKITSLGLAAGQVAQLINKIVIAATLYFGAKAVMAGELTVGQLVAFNMVSQRVLGPVLNLANMWQQFQQARLSVDRIADILNAPTENLVGAKTSLPSIKGNMKLDGVTFRYHPASPAVLKDVSLEIPAGQIVGIVGPSGSGKSTVTKLFQRLFVPEQGRVLIDGVDLNTVDTAWLRRQIGVVLQENVLFSRSIRDNIALSNPGMPDERVVQAAKLAGAHEFIVAQPQGYDTLIGEHGTGLSGGQRQRIAIARALVTNPRILIFDEATSALDLESESIIQENMRSICKGRTVLIIAHRLAAVRQADRIITVEEGRIVEDGTHESLLRSGGRYAKLHSHQSGRGAYAA